jgi:hypothetical protein
MSAVRTQRIIRVTFLEIAEAKEPGPDALKGTIIIESREFLYDPSCKKS